MKNILPKMMLSKRSTLMMFLLMLVLSMTISSCFGCSVDPEDECDPEEYCCTHPENCDN